MKRLFTPIVQIATLNTGPLTLVLATLEALGWPGSPTMIVQTLWIAQLETKGSGN